MAKYRAKATASYPYKEGDIVNFNDPLVPGFAAHFEPYDGDEEPTDINARNPLNDPTAAGTQLNLGGKTPDGNPQEPVDDDSDKDKQPVVNPSREELKARAQELGIDFAPNITTEKLLELVRAKEAELNGQE